MCSLSSTKTLHIAERSDQACESSEKLGHVETPNSLRVSGKPRQGFASSTRWLGAIAVHVGVHKSKFERIHDGKNRVQQAVRSCEEHRVWDRCATGRQQGPRW